MAKLTENLMQELQELRDSTPLEALRRVDEFDGSRNGRTIAAIILIDCGDAVGELASISKGVDLLEGLSIELGYDANVAYNLANGLQLRARYNAKREACFREQVSDDRFRSRLLFGAVMDDSSASASVKSQMLTNIGILFLETHRWVEALDCFQHALRILPNNAVAAYQEMRRLMLLANLFVSKEESYQSYCHLDALCYRVRHLATVISKNYDVFEQFAGASALPDVKKAVTQAMNLADAPEQQIDNPYFSFVCRKNLALSLHCSAQEISSGRFDLLTIPYVSTSLSDGSGVPEIFAMMNVMKADFSFARQVFFEVQADDLDTPYFETTSHADTLDYAIYGVRYSALTTAQRIAFDILDKISVAIACYLKLPKAQDTSFMKIWGKKKKGAGFVFSGTIKATLSDDNLPLMALFNIYQDISNHEVLGPGFMGAQKQFRNSSTHRFTVLHDIEAESASVSSAIDHKNLEEFKKLTLASLRLARAALFYFVDFIIFSEGHREKERSGLLVSSPVPDHDYIRGHKG